MEHSYHNQTQRLPLHHNCAMPLLLQLCLVLVYSAKRKKTRKIKYKLNEHFLGRPNRTCKLLWNSMNQGGLDSIGARKCFQIFLFISKSNTLSIIKIIFIPVAQNSQYCIEKLASYCGIEQLSTHIGEKLRSETAVTSRSLSLCSCLPVKSLSREERT